MYMQLYPELHVHVKQWSEYDLGINLYKSYTCVHFITEFVSDINQNITKYSNSLADFIN